MSDSDALRAVQRIMRAFLRELVTRHRLTHVQIARELGVSRPAVSLLSTQAQGPNLSTILRLCIAFASEWAMFQQRHPADAQRIEGLFSWTRRPPLAASHVSAPKSGESLDTPASGAQYAALTPEMREQVLGLRPALEQLAARWGEAGSTGQRVFLQALAADFEGVMLRQVSPPVARRTVALLLDALVDRIGEEHQPDESGSARRPSGSHRRGTVAPRPTTPAPRARGAAAAPGAARGLRRRKQGNG
jgi:transcriptional regulator with XRE-family HTH domain